MKKPVREDWNKLVREIKFLHSTMNDKLTLSAPNGASTIEWYVDVDFAVHLDYKSHTGATVFFKGVKVAMQSFSCKQKLNTSSSTTTELVGVDNTFQLILWAPLFKESQGYKVINNVV